ncbi:MAG TPA: HNH endonuclease family protein [Mycobacterium sp.]
MTRATRRCLIAVTAAVALAGLPGFLGPLPRPRADPVPAAENPDAELAKLDTLAIKGRAPKTGYSREQFGEAWSDDVTVPDGHNGCNTRNDILRRDLVDVETKPGTNGCIVASGVLNDPYTGTTIDFHRGRGTSRAVQIDHVVALSNAWQTGAQQWDELTRRNFANDPMNLQATDGPSNERKGDGDAATWLPPNKSYRCTYVSRMVDVKAAYGLWVTQAEHDAITRVLTSGCGQQSAPEPPPPPPEEPASPPLGPPPGDDG